MSQENVTLALKAIEAWNDGGPQEAKRYWAEDYEFHDSPTLPDPKVVRGREAVVTHFEELAAVVGEMRVVVKDARVSDGDEVVDGRARSRERSRSLRPPGSGHSGR